MIQRCHTDPRPLTQVKKCLPRTVTGAGAKHRSGTGGQENHLGVGGPGHPLAGRATPGKVGCPLGNVGGPEDTARKRGDTGHGWCGEGVGEA